MDSIDIQILNALSKDGRTSITQMAKGLEISNVAIQQRIDKMQEAGVIQGYASIMDIKAIGYRTTAYIGIFLEKAKDYKQVLAALDKVPQIVEAHFTTGNYSIFAKIHARDNMDLMNLLSEHIQSIDGIARTETFISLDEGIKKQFILDED